jgi:hypothetical protein
MKEEFATLIALLNPKTRFSRTVQPKAGVVSTAPSLLEILCYEADSLKKFRDAGICAAAPLRLFQLNPPRFLVLERIDGIPLSAAALQPENARTALTIVRCARQVSSTGI